MCNYNVFFYLKVFICQKASQNLSNMRKIEQTKKNIAFFDKVVLCKNQLTILTKNHFILCLSVVCFFLNLKLFICDRVIQSL